MAFEQTQHAVHPPIGRLLFDRRKDALVGPQRLILVDGDDTLWSTEHLYDEARSLAGSIVQTAGLDRAFWENRQREIDRDNVTHMGLSRTRFPTSSVQALKETEAFAGVGDLHLDRQVWDASASVFEAIAPVVPGAAAVLRRLQQLGLVVLLTQGDPEIQRKRVNDANLTESLDMAIVVERKNQQVFQDLAAWLSFRPSNCWMIGNSVPSDINPAVLAGMRAIWIDAHVWAHERREKLLTSQFASRAASLAEGLRVIESAPA